MTTEKHVRLDIRCPLKGRDSIYVVPESAEMIRCKSCGNWHSLLELRGLRTEAFAPRFPDGRVYDGYVGAVRQSEARPSQMECVIEYVGIVAEGDWQ